MLPKEQIRSIVAGVGEVQRPDPHLPPAVALAESLDATLHLVHAFSRPNPLLSPLASMEVSDVDGLERLRSEMQAHLEARAGEAVGKGRIVCHAIPGSTADVILDVAQDVGASLVLVGATQRGKLARYLVRRPSGSCVRRRCPSW